MTYLGRQNAARAIYGACALLAAVVLAGWYFDVRVLISIGPDWVTMKVLTAVSFFLTSTSALMSTSASKATREAGVPLAVGSAAIMLAVFLQGEVPSLLEFAGESEAMAVASTAPGVPSLATMLCFHCLAVSIFAETLGHAWHRYAADVCGAVGLTAVVGYALGHKTLYFEWTGISTAMALLTALMFSALGLARGLYSHAATRSRS